MVSGGKLTKMIHVYMVMRDKVTAGSEWCPLFRRTMKSRKTTFTRKLSIVSTRSALETEKSLPALWLSEFPLFTVTVETMVKLRLLTRQARSRRLSRRWKEWSVRTAWLTGESDRQATTSLGAPAPLTRREATKLFR